MLGSEFAKGVGQNPTFGHFQFGPNGTSDPVISGASSTLTGGLARHVTSITYSATGVYTIVFGVDFTAGAGHRFFCAPHPDTLANWFDAIQVGLYNATTRTLVVQAHRSGTGQAVAAGAAVRINVALFVNDSTAP